MNVFYDPINGWSAQNPDKQFVTENRDDNVPVFIVKNLNGKIIGVKSSHSGACAIAASINENCIVESWNLDGVKKLETTI